MPRAALCLAATMVVSLSGSAWAQMTVQSFSPVRHALAVPRSASISVTFDRPVDPTTFTPRNFHAFARWSGGKPGAVSFSADLRTVTLDPTNDFFAGEMVTVYLSNNLRGADGIALRSAGYCWQFFVAAGAAPMVYRQVQIMSDRSPSNAQTRIYGGLACDLDGDQWADLTIINEVSSDVRVFMNRDDGSCTFHPFLTPPTPIAYESSANSPGDFNLDGLADVCTASSAENKVSVLLGNGDGTFQSTIYTNVGSSPHGIAVLDADGDGDMDIATANTGAGNVSLLLNDGNGVFSPPTFFNGGGSGEYGLAAADMNNDGILDLISANQYSQNICILLGNGTFTLQPCQSAGGNTWMIRCGDFNGDGNMDVSSANSSSSTGSILLGNGNGTLQAPRIVPTASGAISTDVADLDGDGDLDWVMSHFQGSQWRVFRNDGAGNFSFHLSFPAVANAACVILADLDNDGDIDIACLDEIADVVIIRKSICPADFNEEGGVTVQDVYDFLAQWSAGHPSANFNGIGGVTVQDIYDFLTAWNAASDGTCF